MGAYGEHSSRLCNFEGFKLVTNLKETKEAKCKTKYTDFFVEKLKEAFALQKLLTFFQQKIWHF